MPAHCIFFHTRSVKYRPIFHTLYFMLHCASVLNYDCEIFTRSLYSARENADTTPEITHKKHAALTKWHVLHRRHKKRGQYLSEKLSPEEISTIFCQLGLLELCQWTACLNVQGSSQCQRWMDHSSF